MTQSGFTLIELLVVLGIVGILMVAMGFEFIGWKSKYNAEADIKKMYVDLSNVRSKAIQTKKLYFMDIPAGGGNEYNFYIDNDPDSVGELDIANDELVEFLKTTDGLANNIRTQTNPLRFTLGFTMSGLAFDASTNKIITSPMWIRVVAPEVDPETLAPYELYADIDCLEIISTRINLGKYDVAADKCVTK
jgi:prepilin-type N-terminal cleavage/methylation domain-containing protein